jgi:uncharacterized membrane protein
VKNARTARGLWCVVVLLVTIGVAASIGRAAFLSDFASRIEPVRQQVLHALGRHDPFVQKRAAELPVFDGRFAAHPTATILHILPGGLFLLFAPLQFSSRLRTRHLQFHRWSGRLLAITAIIAASTGLYFGLFMPFAGLAETVPIALFGGLLGYAIVKAVVAIRSGQVERHREWMIRAFALALAIATVRIFGAVLDLTATPAGLGPRPAFVIAIWAGWLTTVSAAELWIRSTRGGDAATGMMPERAAPTR